MPAVAFPLVQPELRFEADGGTRVSRTVHPSGLRILSEQVPGAQSVTVGFWIPAGSRDEAPEAAGSTHFLEHLLFKGTRTRSALDIAVAFDGVGGDHNAVTSKEYTCYYGKVRDRDLPLAVEVLCDMLADSVIDAHEFELERGVILEELAAADDDPGDVAGERFAEAVFGTHPLGRPVGGSPAVIEATGREAVLDHYRAHYTPRELVVVAAGALDHDGLVRMVLDGLARGGWDLEADAAPIPRRDTTPVALAPLVDPVVVERPLEQLSLVLGTGGIVATSPQRPALGVLSAVLGGGMSSRLFQEVRERRGLVYGIHAYAPAYADTGYFAIGASCTPRKAAEVVKVATAEFERLAEEPMSEAELRRAKGQLSGTAALALEDSDVRMNRLARAEIVHGEFQDLHEATGRLEAVSAEAVQALAAQLVAGPRSLVAVGPVAAGSSGLLDAAAGTRA